MYFTNVFFKIFRSRGNVPRMVFVESLFFLKIIFKQENEKCIRVRKYILKLYSSVGNLCKKVAEEC